MIPMTPAMDAAPGAKIPAAASGVGVGEDADPAEAPAESVESWLLVPPVPAESVPVAEFEESVVVAVFAPAVLVDVPIVVAAAEL
jgi:hypothetical protein